MEVGDWMKIGTYHIRYNPHHELRMAAREVARKMWVIYSELVRAGFSEDQSLALLLELTAEEKGGENK
jgi:hypothetical protein